MKKDHKTKGNIRKRDYSPIIVIILGLVFGGLLIGVGVTNSVKSDYDTMGIKTEEELKSLVDEKTKAYEDLREKRQAEYDISALSEEYEKLTREMTTVEGELYDAEAELFNVQSGKYDGLKNEKYLGSIPLIICGAVVIVVALGLAMKMSTSKKKNVILTVTEEK